ncbi:hypothetical protein NDU88_000687 [Pleurodeles waltl]|uniref:Uncharacterized protein n=1 Tax=Pleurodeles waltl TaxID=8319 RepID=A0AAV7MHK6_PLEWA|nr:hypothetical protein NDU88_000687 [Pleurodeles waltl]
MARPLHRLTLEPRARQPLRGARMRSASAEHVPISVSPPLYDCWAARAKAVRSRSREARVRCELRHAQSVTGLAGGTRKHAEAATSRKAAPLRGGREGPHPGPR